MGEEMACLRGFYPPGHMGKIRFPGEIVLFSFTHHLSELGRFTQLL